MTTVLLILIVVLQVTKPDVSRLWARQRAATSPSGELVAAIRAAYLFVGLPAEQFSDAFDLQRTGKLQEVLQHASLSLDLDHGLRTVGDVVAYLHGAAR